ncbi:CPBP family intramembrane glutamic endopeptidase [Ferruginibacter sp. HRS2-29]|uniref:CPBP family intramembrane glutamic endopeptidase n=1 Tax=Ferruginibacter sp. HRS2-29 TaxID=2487334 RepID=UPI0020CD1DA7|nr:CPBP family intramembrane glutamic endopeptidase [Ferruginibacter sp. HRS2-29]
MEYKSVKGFTGLGQLGVLFVFLGAGFILTMVVQMIIGMYVTPAGTSFEQMTQTLQATMMKPENIGALRLSQVLGTFTFFFLSALGYSLVTNGKSLFWLGFSKYFNIGQVLIAFGIIYAASMCASPLAVFTKNVLAHYPSLNSMAKTMEDAYNAQVLAMSNLKSWPEFVMALFIIAFFPAMFEEVLFRGALQNLLVKWWKKPLIAILVTSVIFSIIHMSIYLFLSRVVLSLALGMIYHKGKNIWVNIIAHFINNALGLAMLFYMSMQKQKLDVSKLEPKVAWYVGLFGVGLLVLFYALFERVSKNEVAKIEARENILQHDDPIATLGKNVNPN